jgi:hypothetical protein
MGAIFGDRGATGLVLFSPALIDCFMNKKTTRLEQPRKSEAEVIENDESPITPQSLKGLQTLSRSESAEAPEARRIFNTLTFSRGQNNSESLKEETNHEVLLSLLVAAGGAGLAIFLARASLGNLNLRKSFSKLPFLSASPTLLYSTLAVSTICSTTMLYTNLRQNTSFAQRQLDILSTLEDQASRQAKSQKIALQTHYQDHLKSLQEQYQTAKNDTLAATAKIKAAEQSAWSGAHQAKTVVSQLEYRVSRMEDETKYLSKLVERQLPEGERLRSMSSRRWDDHEYTYRGVDRRWDHLGRY